MSREEAAIVLAAMPIDMIYAELQRKITKLCDFRDRFEALTKAREYSDEFDMEELNECIKREA